MSQPTLKRLQRERERLAEDFGIGTEGEQTTGLTAGLMLLELLEKKRLQIVPCKDMNFDPQAETIKKFQIAVSNSTETAFIDPLTWLNRLLKQEIVRFEPGPKATADLEVDFVNGIFRGQLLHQLRRSS